MRVLASGETREARSDQVSFAGRPPPPAQTSCLVTAAILLVKQSIELRGWPDFSRLCLEVGCTQPLAAPRPRLRGRRATRPLPLPFTAPNRHSPWREGRSTSDRSSILPLFFCHTPYNYPLMQSSPPRPPHFTVRAASSARRPRLPGDQRVDLSSLLLSAGHAASPSLLHRYDQAESFEAKAHQWIQTGAKHHRIDVDMASSAILYQALAEYTEQHAYRHLFRKGERQPLLPGEPVLRWQPAATDAYFL